MGDGRVDGGLVPPKKAKQLAAANFEALNATMPPISSPSTPRRVQRSTVLRPEPSCKCYPAQLQFPNANAHSPPNSSMYDICNSSHMVDHRCKRILAEHETTGLLCSVDWPSSNLPVSRQTILCLNYIHSEKCSSMLSV